MRHSAGSGRSALRKGRCSEPNAIYLVTTVTDQRIPWFQVDAFARIMCRCLLDTGCRLDAENLCWVVMPDHLHVLVQLGGSDLAGVVRQIKARSALRLNREIGRTGRFWAPSFHDHRLRREEDLKAVARYIVANPLRAGLVDRVGAYPYWNAIWL